MTEEVEYADQAEDNKQEFSSKCDLSCQRGHSEIHLWWNMHMQTCMLDCVFMWVSDDICEPCVHFECVSRSQHGDANIFEWLFDKSCRCSTYMTASAVIPPMS